MALIRSKIKIATAPDRRDLVWVMRVILAVRSSLTLCRPASLPVCRLVLLGAGASAALARPLRCLHVTQAALADALKPDGNRFDRRLRSCSSARSRRVGLRTGVWPVRWSGGGAYACWLADVRYGVAVVAGAASVAYRHGCEIVGGGVLVRARGRASPFRITTESL
jgi:hypothetical protein